MRVAMVVTGGVDAGGRERVIPVLLWLIERLARRHEVHVYALRYLPEPRDYPLLGATVHDLGRPEGARRQYAALVRALKRDGPFDVVHAHWALPAGFVGSLAARRLDIPSVVVMDSGEFTALPDIGYGLQIRRRQRLAVAATIRLATRVAVCSRFHARLAEAHGTKPEIIPLGVDARVFTSATRPDGPPWRLLHVASLNKVKDQPTLLAALAGASRLVPDLHLDIVGADTLDGAVPRCAVALGVDRRVTFHGFQPTDSVAGLYREAHLFIQSSRHEAGGIAVLEAAASGLPSVGTAVGHLADWTPERAITVAPGDADALALAIVRVLEDAPTRARLAAAAREWTLAHDADWTAAAFDRVYAELVTARRR